MVSLPLLATIVFIFGFFFFAFKSDSKLVLDSINISRFLKQGIHILGICSNTAVLCGQS